MNVVVKLQVEAVLLAGRIAVTDKGVVCTNFDMTNGESYVTCLYFFH
jgi:hypothetical protein